MNSSLQSPDYQRQGHHLETVVYAAASGLEFLSPHMKGHLQEGPKCAFVVEPPRILRDVQVDSLIKRGEALLATALKRTFFTNHPYQLNPEEDLRFPVVKHVFSTAYIRSFYGKLMDPSVTVVRSEAFNVHVDMLAAYARSELLEDVYADIFLVSIGRFDEECSHRAQLWLERLIGPLVDYIFKANLDSPLPQLNRTLPISRQHIPPVTNVSIVHRPVDLPILPPSSKSLPPRVHDLDAAPSSTLADSTQPQLVNEKQANTRGQASLTNSQSKPSSSVLAAGGTPEQSQGPSVSPSSSSGDMLSPSSRGFSLKAVLKQGKAKLVSSTSFSRLASSLGSKGRFDAKASPSQPVPQMSSLAFSSSPSPTPHINEAQRV